MLLIYFFIDIQGLMWCVDVEQVLCCLEYFMRHEFPYDSQVIIHIVIT